MTNDADTVSAYVRRVVARYLTVFPHESARQELFLNWLRTTPDAIMTRDNASGHVTVSSVILHQPSNAILLIQHPVLGLWVPPGGHIDRGELPVQACLREASEETGVAGLCVHAWHARNDIPIDIDTHTIPASEVKGEPRHPHFDFRYVFTADRRDAALKGECQTGRWVELSSSFLRSHTDMAEVGQKILAYCRHIQVDL